LSKIISASKGRPVSQNDLSKFLNMPQQTISRKLVEMERLGYIRRHFFPEGEIILPTEKGLSLLQECYIEIKETLELKYQMKLRGKVVTGLGEGKIFLSKEYYKEGFKRILGFVPYPGTLNVLINDEESMRNRIDLDTIRGLEIPEHKERDMVLGAVKAFPARIRSLEAALVIPARTIHPRSVVEIISPYNLRRELSLSDGDEVEIEVLT
jgi:riboflavin kinase